MSIALVTGPSRSGKSAFAEALAAGFQQPVTYVATARRIPDDLEWQARIDRHRQQRPTSWTTLEIPLELPQSLADADSNQTYLVDSLGTWVANWIECDEVAWQGQVDRLLLALQGYSGNCVLVGEEVGWSVVPAYELGRRFRDRMGLLNQTVGTVSDSVYLVTAGFAIDLRKVGMPIDSLTL